MENVTISVENVSKSFRIYHEHKNSIYEEIGLFFRRKKPYEILQVLNNITFDVKKGEMIGIIGRNGSGKTTLLRILSKIFKPDSGRVTVNGIILPIFALGLGFHPELTARANIVQNGILFGFSKKEIMDKTDEILQFAELEKFSDTKLKNFSTGMHLRLAFSSAVQVKPDVLILDEVLTVGDVSFQKKSFDKIMSMKKSGTSILFVSHDMNSIRQYCDRALFLDNGKIEALGDPDSVVQAYLDRYENKN